jgi:hypothetical protein
MTTNAKQTKQTYNGWPNRETWNVMLWLDNDEGLYRCYREEMRVFRGRLSAAKAKEIVHSVFFPATKTPDGISLDSTKIRWDAIAAAMKEEN